MNSLPTLTVLLLLPATLGVLPFAQALVSVPLTQTTHAAPILSPSTPAVTGTVAQVPLQTSSTTHHSTPIVSNSGLILSPASEPFPRKLVNEVQSGQYIDMRELLSDNISLLQQLESVHGTNQLPAVGPSRPRLREVSTLTTWTYCFLGYAAILTSDPNTRDHLAYARLIIREAQRHGGQGWMDYDRLFHQQAAVEEAVASLAVHPTRGVKLDANQSSITNNTITNSSVTQTGIRYHNIITIQISMLRRCAVCLLKSNLLQQKRR